MAKKKSEPSPPDNRELIERNEDQLASPSPENMDDDSSLQENAESSPDFVDMPTGAETTGEAETISEEATATDEETGNDYASLLQELSEDAPAKSDGSEPVNQEESERDISNKTESEELPLPGETSAFPDTSQIDTGVIAPVIEDDAVLRSPILTHRRERILTIDAKDEIQTEEEREATIWHEIQNAYRTRRILTGTLDGIEKMDSGLTLAVVNYKGFRVVIPIKQMMLHVGRMPSGAEYADLMDQLSCVLNARLGSEIDFIIKGIENKTRSIVASRKDAMLKKRQTFFMDTDEQGTHLIYEGRVVQARVVAVAEKIIRIEVFGVECSIRAQGLSWEWIGNAKDHFNVGDRILVRITKIDRPDVENISISADVRSVSSATNFDNLKKCVPQSRYAGRVTDVRNGVVYIRLNNGVNAIAHSCYDRRTPGKRDDVSFAVTRIDEEQGVAIGIITRIIKQNL